MLDNLRFHFAQRQLCCKAGTVKGHQIPGGEGHFGIIEHGTAVRLGDSRVACVRQQVQRVENRDFIGKTKRVQGQAGGYPGEPARLDDLLVTNPDICVGTKRLLGRNQIDRLHQPVTLARIDQISARHILVQGTRLHGGLGKGRLAVKGRIDGGTDQGRP